MPASEADQPEEGNDNRSARPGILVVFFILFAVLGGVFGAAVNHQIEKSKMDELEVQHQSTEANSVQRELRAYAKANELPITKITVTREGDKLMVSWKQASQTCTTEAIRPKGDSFWVAAGAEEGSGKCQTDSASDVWGGGSG